MLATLKKLLAPYRDIVEYREPLKGFTSFRLGGPAAACIAPKTIAQLQDIYELLNRNNVPIFILGKGSNLLVRDKGVKGVVLRAESRGFKTIGNELVVSAGYPLQSLVIDTMRLGLSGLEPLVGIPGTIGGAVRMNAGGKYGDISRIVESVWIVDKKGKIESLAKAENELQFAYRSSNLQGKLISDVIIKLASSDAEKVNSRIREILDEKRVTQPLDEWSAGCVFKNPPNQSAGALIDQAGLKGHTSGGAQVSAKHANFIVNTGTATSKDVLKLISLIKKRVKRKFNIELELEIEIW
jgi:UDP-N-acetylmuramate dehydrogenase